MCNVGGGDNRCEYADMITNVRKKARYKYREDQYDRERKVEKDVRKWKDANPELVKAHLPEKMPFHFTPKDRPIPKELTAMLTPSSRVPVTGKGSAEERQAAVKTLNESYEKWKERLNLDEDRSVGYYTMAGFSLMNAVLRKKGFHAELKKEFSYVKNEDEASEILSRTKEQVASLKSALKKSTPMSEPRKLYRFFRVPAGVTPTEFMEKYLATGEGFSDPAFMSTTADPEFIMSHMHDRNEGKTNHGYVVMEILTKQGQSLQQYPFARPGNIQSMESEVLLPAGTKLRVAGHNKVQRFEYGSDRKDLHQQYNMGAGSSDWMFREFGHHSQGDRLNFPMIKLVDEKLIDEWEKKAKTKLK